MNGCRAAYLNIQEQHYRSAPETGCTVTSDRQGILIQFVLLFIVISLLNGQNYIKSTYIVLVFSTDILTTALHFTLISVYLINNWLMELPVTTQSGHYLTESY